MFSVQKFLSQDNALYDLLEASAEEARHSVQVLNEILSSPQKGSRVSETHETKEADKKITAQINEALATAFITELDREDVEALSAVLYKIPKTVEKFAERFMVYSAMVKEASFTAHIKLLEDATKQVVAMVQQVRLHPSVEKIQEMNLVLQQIETEADELILQLLTDLYSGRHEPLTVLAMRDLYELLEKVIDRCRDTGNVVTQIIVKTA